MKLEVILCQDNFSANQSSVLLGSLRYHPASPIEISFVLLIPLSLQKMNLLIKLFKHLNIFVNVIE